MVNHKTAEIREPEQDPERKERKQIKNSKNQVVHQELTLRFSMNAAGKIRRINFTP
jgi:hypothetical protein